MPSNVHWIEVKILETMLKSTSIHNTERLTHFHTSQVAYVNGLNCLIDQFPKQPVHLKRSQFQLSINDVTSHLNFFKFVLSESNRAA